MRGPHVWNRNPGPSPTEPDSRFTTCYDPIPSTTESRDSQVIEGRLSKPQKILIEEGYNENQDTEFEDEPESDLFWDPKIFKSLPVVDREKEDRISVATYRVLHGFKENIMLEQDAEKYARWILSEEEHCDIILDSNSTLMCFLKSVSMSFAAAAVEVLKALANFDKPSGRIRKWVRGHANSHIRFESHYFSKMYDEDGFWSHLDNEARAEGWEKLTEELLKIIKGDKTLSIYALTDQAWNNIENIHVDAVQDHSGPLTYDPSYEDRFLPSFPETYAPPKGAASITSFEDEGISLMITEESLPPQNDSRPELNQAVRYNLRDSAHAAQDEDVQASDEWDLRLADFVVKMDSELERQRNNYELNHSVQLTGSDHSTPQFHHQPTIEEGYAIEEITAVDTGSAEQLTQRLPTPTITSLPMRHTSENLLQQGTDSSSSSAAQQRPNANAQHEFAFSDVQETGLQITNREVHKDAPHPTEFSPSDSAQRANESKYEPLTRPENPPADIAAHMIQPAISVTLIQEQQRQHQTDSENLVGISPSAQPSRITPPVTGIPPETLAPKPPTLDPWLVPRPKSAMGSDRNPNGIWTLYPSLPVKNASSIGHSRSFSDAPRPPSVSDKMATLKPAQDQPARANTVSTRKPSQIPNALIADDLSPSTERLVADVIGYFVLESVFEADAVKHYVQSTKPQRGRQILKEERVWRRMSLIGSGGFSDVWLEKKDSELRAVKVVRKCSPLDYKRELYALSLLSKHPLLFVEFYGWFEDPQNVYIAMEYFENGDLGAFIANTHHINEAMAAEILYQILEGLQVMVEQGFAHRDLKPQNIFVRSLDPIWVKIGDLGLSKRLLGNTALRTYAYTPLYAAPEVCGCMFHSPEDAQTSYTNAVDVWSMGVIAYELLTKRVPFENSIRLVYYVGGQFAFPIEPLMRARVGLEMVEWVREMLTPLPGARPTVEMCLNDGRLARARGVDGG